MADEISETKTRYERLDPNVVKVFRLAELANKDNEDCHLGELLKFSEDTAMTILMALDCEDNLPPLTERAERQQRLRPTALPPPQQSRVQLHERTFVFS